MKTYKDLPLGTVIKIKDVKKYIMIVGKKATYSDYIFDYVGVYYPEGFGTQDTMLPFNNKAIEKIIFIGNTNNI